MYRKFVEDEFANNKHRGSTLLSCGKHIEGVSVLLTDERRFPLDKWNK